MTKQKHIAGLIAVVLLFIATSHSIFPSGLQNEVDVISSSDPLDINAQEDNPRPDWEKIILNAFQAVGASGEIVWQSKQDSYYSAYVRNYLLEGHNLSFSISTKSSFDMWFCETCPSSNFEPQVQEIGILLYPAKLLTVYRKNLGFLEWHEIDWEMDGLFYSVVYTAISYKGTADPLYPAAEAFCSTAGGKQSNAPSGIPQPESPPSDLCAEVNCENNYCEEDGSKYLYDCACDPNDGGCYCRGDVCDQGCDAEQGGCLLVQEGFCAGVDCGSDYCLEDGQTRIYNCKCDPDDGECYCYSETCDAGCNMATGRCVESMVIEDQSSIDDYIYYDDSQDLMDTLGVIGGIAVGGGVAIGGGYLGFKAIQGMLAKRALAKGGKIAAKAVAQASEPSLSELLERAERSANRALKSIDGAETAAKADQLRYKEMVSRNVKYDAKWAKTMSDRAALLEKAEMGVRAVKKGADIGAELIGNIPGGGQTYKYGYNMVTAGVESAASGDSLGTVVLKTAQKGVETGVGDLLFGKVTVLDKMPKGTMKMSVKQVVKNSGADNLFAEALKNENFNNLMNGVKELKKRTPMGKIKRLKIAAKSIDRKAVGKVIKKILYSR